jgi:hypothetical protein
MNEIETPLEIAPAPPPRVRRSIVRRQLERSEELTACRCC